MSFLNDVSKGKIIGAQIHVIYGNNGVGKTTWAASFPNALIVDLENGSRHLNNVSRILSDKVPNLEAFKKLLKELRESAHDFKTIVIDSVESLEGLISDEVCSEGKVNSIEKYEGGYGKGYARSREIMRDIFSYLIDLRSKGISVILVAHSQVRSVTDPATNQTYDRVVMRCNDKMAALIRDLSDNVFYATYKTFTEDARGKTKAWGDGQRVLFCQWRPGADAKNRLDLPLELPLSYDSFREATNQAPENLTSNLISEIEQMSAKVNAELKAQVKEQIERFKDNPTKLNEVKNRLMKYVAA